MVNVWKLKGLLLLGFIAHLVATAEAATSPATGYELSIYRATPITYWVGIGQAFLVALVVGVYGRRRIRDGGILLAALSGLSVLSLPIIRGYYYRGVADPLTHLGYARLIQSGALAPIDLHYPGTHLVALFIGAGGGISLPLAIQYMILLFVGLYLVYVPLAVRGIVNRGVASVAGVFAALLFLPINQVGTHPSPHPSSQAILFLPLVLYLLFNYVSVDQPVDRRSVTGVGVLLALSLVALVVIHPQEALDVLLVLGAVAGIQFVARRWRRSHPVADHRPVYGQTLFLLVVFIAWTSRHEIVRNWVERTLTSVFAGGAGASEVATRAAVLPAIGSSIEELFFRLFLVHLVFTLVVGAFLLASLRGHFDGVVPDRNALVKYQAVGLVPLFGMFAVVFIAALGDHYFRFLGAIMVFVTILGAVAFTVGLPSIVGRPSRVTVRRIILVAFVFLLPFAMATIHPSPFIFQPSDQVTEMEVRGYEQAFEHRDPAIEFLTLRDTAPRYVDAIHGPESDVAGEFDEVNETAFREDLLGADDDPRYLAVTERDRAREIELYDGFRYPRAGFESLESTPGINKVQSNGDFELYQIGPTAT